MYAHVKEYIPFNYVIDNGVGTLETFISYIPGREFFRHIYETQLIIFGKISNEVYENFMPWLKGIVVLIAKAIKLIVWDVIGVGTYTGVTRWIFG